MRQPEHILVPTDFSEASFESFEYAAYYAKMSGARLTLFAVVQDWAIPPVMMGQIPYPEGLAEYRNSLLKSAKDRLETLAKEKFHGLKVEVVTLLSEQSPAQEIAAYAKANSVNLIIISTQGKNALAHLILGSTLQKLLKLAPVPILTIPSAKKDS